MNLSVLAIGPFSLDEVVDFKKLQSLEDIEQHLISIEEIERRLQGYHLDQ